MLLRVYAKCIDGQDQIAKRRIEEALGEPTMIRPPVTTTARIDLGAYWAQPVGGQTTLPDRAYAGEAVFSCRFAMVVRGGGRPADLRFSDAPG